MPTKIVQLKLRTKEKRCFFVFSPITTGLVCDRRDKEIRHFFPVITEKTKNYLKKLCHVAKM